MNKLLRRLILNAGLVGGLLFVANAAGAGPNDRIANERAKTDYTNYCASCHGAGGAGNGPMASELKSKPANLTLLAKNNNGHFPYLKLRNIIDGSYNEGQLRAHSSNEMPIWGDAFRRESIEENSYMAAQARIMNILDYIATLQH